MENTTMMIAGPAPAGHKVALSGARPQRALLTTAAWIAAAAPAIAATSAHAQDTAPSQEASLARSGPGDADTSGENSRVEEIIVTAQRREENLQRVPVSVTALTANDLARSNITSTAALTQVTPGLTWTSANRSALPYIRAVGSPDFSVGSESSIAIYVDGIYLENSPASMFTLNNIERIEVLKGPQGTLFGRNATGGLVHIITKQPSRDLGGSFEIGYGNYDTLSSNGYLTGPLGQDVSADLALTINHQGKGWGRNIFLDREINRDRTFAGRSKVLFDLGDTRFTLGGDYTKQKTDIGAERNIVAGRTSRPINGVPTQPVPGFRDSQSNIYPLGMLQTGGVNLNAERSLGFATLKSISSLRKTRFTAQLDADEIPLSVIGLSYNTKVKALTQELQLASEGGGRLRWIVGAFYMHRVGQNDPSAVSGSIVGFPPFLGRQVTVAKVTSNVIAPYGQATLTVGSGTELTAGLRYTIEKQRIVGTQSGLTGVVTATADARKTYKEPTWRLAVNQNFTDTILGYASYSTGFKSGVFNVGSLLDPPALPEKIDAYEVGFKTDFLDRRLRLNGAVYQYEYDDIQLAVPTGPISRTINAARARIRGAEVSMNAVPVDGLRLNVGLSYIPTAKYVSFPNAPAYPAVPTGGNRQISYDGSGGRMIRAPKFTSTIGGSYIFAVGAGDIEIGGDFYHSSSFRWNVAGLVRQPSYEIVNGQVAYTMESGVSIKLWVRNLFDKDYAAGVSETSTASVYNPAPPRTYGVKLGYTF